MKTILLLLTLIVTTVATAVGQSLTWKMPEATITLMQGETKIAALKPVYESKTATLIFKEEHYQFNLNTLKRTCAITRLTTGEKIADVKGLPGKTPFFNFTKGKTITLTRSGNKKSRNYKMGNELLLSVSETSFDTTLKEVSTEQIIMQATIVFVHAYAKFERDRSDSSSSAIIIQ